MCLPWCNCVCRRNSEEILWSSCGLRAVFMFVLSVGRRRAGVRIGGWFSPRDKCHARAHTTMECFCSFVPEAAIRASPGNAPAPMPPNQCRRRQDTRCSGASDPEMGPGEVLCSTGQAPRGPHLCCHSLPSDGRDRPFRGRVPTPLVTPIVAAVSRSGMGAWAGSCGEMGWDGSVWAHSRMFTVCCTGFPRGGTFETPPGDLRPGVQCSCHLC